MTVDRNWIGLAVVAVCLLATPVSADNARGLDHSRHQTRASAAGSEMTCTSCHSQSDSGFLRNKPGHSWCFGKCHTEPAKKTGRKPYVIAAAQRPLCEVCHSAKSIKAAQTSGSVALRGTPSFGAGDFQTTLSHAAHDEVDCASCHRFGAKVRAHSRCASCHTRKAKDSVPMSRCESCHVGATAAQAPAPAPFAVDQKFSHAKHNPRVGQKCTGCHPDASEATAMTMARPAKATCTGCHDGKASFSTDSADCRKCHASPSGLGQRVRAAPVTLSHASHGETRCETCHEQGGSFRAKAGHALCSNGECHAGEFASRSPKICSSCHVGTEPWLPQHIDPPRRTTSDFGVEFAHRKHDVTKCTSCHSSDPDGADDGLGGRHASCSGAKCHDTGANAPVLSECEKCHAIGQRTTRRRTTEARRWSVAEKFVHATHETGTGGQALPCTSCHLLDRTTTPNRDIASPPKSACADCHDGNAAFKLTGHGCKRCH